MRKVIFMSFILLGVIFFAGCSKKYEPNIDYAKYTKPSDLFREIGMKNKGDGEWSGRLAETEKYLKKYCEFHSSTWQTREGIVKVASSGRNQLNDWHHGEASVQATTRGYEKNGRCENKSGEISFRMNCKRGCVTTGRGAGANPCGEIVDNCVVVDTGVAKNRIEDIKGKTQWYFQGR